ncbi:MAG: serine/threonine protein kinase [Nitriliruptoraceae bacterium]|nr:serine/threonine protein kinase [Nitriliruptoraceae bacterium]
MSEVAAGTLIAGRYRLLDRLGRGGAGTVWRAEDEQLQRDVAIKVLHPELADDVVAAQRFRREAATAARLAHPHVATVYDIGDEGGRDHLVMELIEGPTLAELLAEEGALSPTVVAEIGRAIADALGAAHDQGLIHRDVKPANVLFTRDGVPKIVDFGIARALDSSATRLTMPGSVMGTARYLSPEQLRDDPLDARADVYALGLMLYEALTGTPPWGSGGAAEVAARRLTEDLPSPAKLRRGVPESLDATIVRATRRFPEDRHRDGRAFASTLAPLTDDAARVHLLHLVTPYVQTPTPRPAPHAGSPSTSRPAPPPPAPAPVPVRAEARAPDRQDATSVMGEASVAPPARPAPPRQRRRRRRGRIGRTFRRLLLILILLAVLAVGIIGVVDLDAPLDLVGDPDAWVDLARAVRDRLVSFLQSLG